MRVPGPSTFFAVALYALTGCYATTSASVTDVASLRRGAHSREVVLKQGPLGVHLGPSSWVRFTLRDGGRSPWFQAGKLRVNAEMVMTTGGRARPEDPSPDAEGIPWDAIASVEVNELDVGETVAGVTMGAAVIVTAAAAELALLAALQAVTDGHVNGDLGLTRAAVDAVGGEALKRPEEDREARVLALDATAADLAATPLFTPEARRRDQVLFTVSTEAGLDAGLTPSPVAGVAAGLRLGNFFDAQLGARASLTPATEMQPAQVRSVPFLRLGLHLDLDAGRRVALAAGADFGLTSEEVRVRFLYGVRVRVSDRLQLGVYPWNPVAVGALAPADSSQSAPAGPSRLNLLELTWLL
jgi:hypothetical protein